MEQRKPLQVKDSKQLELLHFLKSAYYLDGEWKNYTIHINAIEEMIKRVNNDNSGFSTDLSLLTSQDKGDIVFGKLNKVYVSHHMYLSGFVHVYSSKMPEVTLVIPNFKIGLFVEQKIRLLSKEAYKLFNFHGLKGDISKFAVAYIPNILIKQKDLYAKFHNFIEETFINIDFQDNVESYKNRIALITGRVLLRILNSTGEKAEKVKKLYSEKFITELEGYCKHNSTFSKRPMYNEEVTNTVVDMLEQFSKEKSGENGSRKKEKVAKSSKKNKKVRNEDDTVNRKKSIKYRKRRFTLIEEFSSSEGESNTDDEFSKKRKNHISDDEENELASE